MTHLPTYLHPLEGVVAQEGARAAAGLGVMCLHAHQIEHHESLSGSNLTRRTRHPHPCRCPSPSDAVVTGLLVSAVRIYLFQTCAKCSTKELSWETVYEPAHNREETSELDDISNHKDQCIEYFLALGSTWSRDDYYDSDNAEKRHSYVYPVKDGLPKSLGGKRLNAAPEETG